MISNTLLLSLLCFFLGRLVSANPDEAQPSSDVLSGAEQDVTITKDNFLRRRYHSGTSIMTII